MQASNAPSKSPVPFAEGGSKNTIPVASQIGVTPGLASFTDGFPPLTMTPLAAGGVPPRGQDFNGILYFLSAAVRWKQAGGSYVYDLSFATSVGGYPKGAILLKADLSGFWISTVDSNVANPDTGGAGWADPMTGRLINVQVFPTAGTFTYTPTSGTRSIVVEVQGAGGAGGGSQATGASTVSTCPGGNAGAYGKSRIVTGFASVSVMVGAPGSGVLGASGGSGGASSFGALVSAPGGQGGQSYTAGAAPVFCINNSAQTSATGGNIVNASGGRGQPGAATSVTFGGSGEGGASVYGSGGRGIGVVATPTNGVAGVAPGSGGSGGAGGAGAGATTGGTGAPGIVIVWEYA